MQALARLTAATALSWFALTLAACSTPASTDAHIDAAIESTIDAVGEVIMDASDTPTVTQCRMDVECSDGVFCNGIERCAPSAPGADARGCLMANPPSPCPTGQVCNEGFARCEVLCADDDHDGHRAAACGGDDCDDSDPNRFPGNAEVCALDIGTMTRMDARHDEDCDASTYANAVTRDGDYDGDGYVDQACCNTNSSGMTVCGTDCEDLAPVIGVPASIMTTVSPGDIHPNQAEVCNGVDDNCNRLTDEGVSTVFNPDCDGDSFGDINGPGMPGCTPSQFPPCMGHQPVTNGTDCDDTRDVTHPGALEACDVARLDENCNGAANEGCTCIDGTSVPCGSGLPGCPSGTQTCSAGRLGTCSVAATPLTCYADGDSDGYAPTGAATSLACTCPTRTTSRAPASSTTIDCNDGVASAHPGSAEVCGAVDDNCDGRVDENLHFAIFNTVPLGTFSRCSGVATWGRQTDCIGDVAGWCAGPAARPPGACPYNTGFGHLDITTTSVNVFCAVADRHYDIARTDLGGGCSEAPLGYYPCAVASQQYCASRGYVAGFGYVTAVPTLWGVDCFSAVHAEVRTVGWSTLNTFRAGCDSATADGSVCNPAIHLYCRSAGFATGFGPYNRTATSASFACLRSW